MSAVSVRAALALFAAAITGAPGAAQAPPRPGAFIDPTVRPGDDFFAYANGGWIRTATIPPDRPGISAVSEAADRVQADVQAIVARVAAAPQPPRSDAAKLAAFYRSATDGTTREARGLAPIAPQLAAVRRARDLPALARLMGRSNADLFASPFALSVDVDSGRPRAYAVTLRQAGLGLPDRAYYGDPKLAGVREAYRDYVARLLAAAGWPDAPAQAGAIVALETRIAAVTLDRAAARDPVATYNPATLAALSQRAPGFPWAALLDGAGIGTKARLIVAERDAVPAIGAIVAATPLPVLKAWLAFGVIDNAAPYLDRGTGAARFAFRQKTLLGQPAPAPAWKQALQIVAGGDIFSPERADHFGNMGWAVGRLYVAAHFSAADRAAVEAMAANVQRAMAARLRANDWLAPATKQAALTKLAAYRFKIGFPRRWRSYAGVTIRADDLVGNVLRLAAADWRYRTAMLGRPVDRDGWQMTPQTIDAYHGQMLDLVFPAAVLTAAYRPGADAATNYGAAATIIGHELTHGFDDWGRHFDASGALADWWSAADAAAFAARSARLADQFSAFEPLPGKFVNGRLTLGENIADLGGLSLALDAYRLSLSGKVPPAVDGLSGEQRVFLGWAGYLRGVSRPEALARQLAADPHAPRQYRLNGPVRNIDSWYDAFAVTPDQRLYLPPAARVRIW